LIHFYKRDFGIFHGALLGMTVVRSSVNVL